MVIKQFPIRRLKRSHRPPDRQPNLLPFLVAIFSVLSMALVVLGQSPGSAAARAVGFENQGNYQAALGAYNEAIDGSPFNALLLTRRGGLHFKMGNNPAALRDFDQAIKFDPDIAPQLWQRGISLYYAERWDECQRQFELHRTVNASDVENATWHFLCVARRDGVEAARRLLLPAPGDRRVPMAEIYRFFAGTGGEPEVLDAATNAEGEPIPERWFYAHLYLGLFAEVNGEAEVAQVHLLEAAEQNFPHYMGDVARVHLALRGWR